LGILNFYCFQVLQLDEPEDESQIDRRHWVELASEEEESDMDEDGH
jgi:hypothetical protein